MFHPIPFRHKERAPWKLITHVRLRKGVEPDTDDARRVLKHIKEHADDNGIAAISAIEPNFPARQKHLPHRRSMEVDLRHMANERNAGTNDQNKGLLDLGWMISNQ